MIPINRSLQIGTLVPTNNLFKKIKGINISTNNRSENRNLQSLQKVIKTDSQVV